MPKITKPDWQPTASLANLQLRAQVLRTIREFFVKRNVLEVETPLLSHATVTDIHLHSLATAYHQPGESNTFGECFYLQTSPEFAMKRLLAAGSGSIYQICKAFRDQEKGRQHNGEFTILEWYRPGFDHHQLMDEMDQLLQTVLSVSAAQRLSYAQAFQHYLAIEPHGANVNALQQCAQQHGIDVVVGLAHDDRDAYLSLLMTHLIEPQLGQQAPTFIYDYPVSQAALAKIRQGEPSVAERFEVYVKGVELANGFHELTDSAEQRHRFEADLQQRREKDLPKVVMDERLLAALKHGLPACAGVALGIDRLVMLAAQSHALDNVMSFTMINA